jgi:hypothetical protein
MPMRVMPVAPAGSVPVVVRLVPASSCLPWCLRGRLAPAGCMLHAGAGEKVSFPLRGFVDSRSTVCNVKKRALAKLVWQKYENSVCHVTSTVAVKIDYVERAWRPLVSDKLIRDITMSDDPARILCVYTTCTMCALSHPILSC